MLGATASCNALLGISDPSDEPGDRTDVGVDAGGDADASPDARDTGAIDTRDGGEALDTNDTAFVTDSGGVETLPDVVDAPDTACTPPTAYQSAVASDAPVDWWELEETGGATATDRGSAPHDATYSGLASELGKPGAVACSLGVVMHGGIVTAPGVPSFQPRRSFSIELWIRPEIVDATPRYLLGRMDSAVGGWYLYSASVGVVFVITGTGGPPQAVTGPALDTTTPSHVVATYDGATDTMSIYVNGTFAASGAGTPMVPDAPTDFTVANNLSFSMLGTTGLYDEIAIYDVALTGSRVAAHFAAR